MYDSDLHKNGLKNNDWLPLVWKSSICLFNSFHFPQQYTLHGWSNSVRFS